MAFQISPGVVTREFDLSLIVPGVGSSTGATAGIYEWGPVDTPVLINSAIELRDIFGKPNDTHYLDWYTAYNFLAYTNRLFNVRVVPTGSGGSTSALNAAAGIAAAAIADPAEIKTYDVAQSTPLLVKNGVDFEDQLDTMQTTGTNGVVAKYPGVYGNRLTVSFADAVSWTSWTYKGAFDQIPTDNDCFAVVLLDGEIVETFAHSKEKAAKNPSGGSGYLAEVINRSSSYIWVIGELMFTQEPDDTYSEINFTAALTGGIDGDFAATEDDERISGFQHFVNSEDIEIDLMMQGGGSVNVGDWVIDNVAEVRQDCVMFVSPQFSDCVGITNKSTIVSNINTTRASYGGSSYAAMDGNWKYQYDIHNDKYRWMPLNGDMAGLHAKTDFDKDPWWAAAGYNRGQVKNTTKLAWNPERAYRDELYKNNVNPVISSVGDGPILLGQKTLLARPSAFDRINVRRLFNVLKRAIGRSAKYSLFEFNDRFTREGFVQRVAPFLRDVQSRRGLQGFKVVCDDTNNTAVRIQRNEFWGDIYIKPNYVAEYIYLNFISTPLGVTFEEVSLDSGDLINI